MAVHTELTPAEAADRLALRELFDAYAHCADRRDAEGQKALFTDDTRFAVYMDGEGSEPTYVLQGREALTPVFEDLNRYEVTTHFNGQSTVSHRREPRHGRELHDRAPRLHRGRRPQDHDRLPSVPRHVHQDRPELVLRRTQSHPRLERDAITRYGRQELMAQQLSFATDIRPLFRDRDIRSMQFAFDLASYEDVRTHAEAIYETLAAGQMPCDGAWPDEDVRRFRSWLDTGTLP